MKEFFIRNYRTLLVAVAAVMAGVGIGVLIGRRTTSADAKRTEDRIGDTTRMERVIHFETCAHETGVPMDPAAYYGYTRDNLAAHYPMASIISFSAEEVRLLQAVPGYCPRHYILRLRDDGMLGVMRTDEAFLTEELVTLVPDETAQLLPNERKHLEEGLPFDTLSEIDTYLESIGS